jgi:tetratricopeptide (TPR) repeat protein
LKIHPNAFALEELVVSLSREHLEVVVHLTRCGTCRRRFQSLLSGCSGPIGKKLAEVLHWCPRGADYGPALRETEQLIQDRRQGLAKERSKAPGLFVELMALPPERRELLLQNSPRFHTWGLFELLVERCFEMSIQSPQYSEDLGFLALRLSDYLDEDHYGEELIEDLRARAWGYIGNSRRVRSDLRGAEEAISKAYSHLGKGTKDLLERAVLLDLEASLRRDQRFFEQASKLLRRAIDIFLQSDQRHRAGRSLVKLSTVYHYSGDPEGGIPLLHQAIELIDSAQEPRLLICAHHNLIDYLAASGRYLEAQKQYREARPLYRNFMDAWTQNRRKWVKGKISCGLGQLDQAEALFLAARQGFIEEEIPFDTALVSLDLAHLYARQRRTGDLKRLAEEMVPIFSSLHIHREALAALAFLKQAAEAEHATVDLVSRVACYLRKAQYDPELRFQEMVS